MAYKFETSQQIYVSQSFSCIYKFSKAGKYMWTFNYTCLFAQYLYFNQSTFQLNSYLCTSQLLSAIYAMSTAYSDDFAIIGYDFIQMIQITQYNKMILLETYNIFGNEGLHIADVVLMMSEVNGILANGTAGGNIILLNVSYPQNNSSNNANSTSNNSTQNNSTASNSNNSLSLQLILIIVITVIFFVIILTIIICCCRKILSLCFQLQSNKIQNIQNLDKINEKSTMEMQQIIKTKKIKKQLNPNSIMNDSNLKIQYQKENNNQESKEQLFYHDVQLSKSDKRILEITSRSQSEFKTQNGSMIKKESSQGQEAHKEQQQNIKSFYKNQSQLLDNQDFRKIKKKTKNNINIKNRKERREQRLKILNEMTSQNKQQDKDHQ